MEGFLGCALRTCPRFNSVRPHQPKGLRYMRHKRLVGFMIYQSFALGLAKDEGESYMRGDQMRFAATLIIAILSTIVGAIIAMVDAEPRFPVIVLIIALFVVPIFIYLRAARVRSKQLSIEWQKECEHEARARVKMVEYRRLHGIPEPER